MKGLSFFDKVIYSLNSIAVIALLFAYIAGFISPQWVWFLAFFGLAYPFILVINVAFAVYWIVKLKKQFLLSFIFILIGFPLFSKVFQWNEKEQAPEEAVKVMSYNVRLFDLYNWSNNKETRNKIFKLFEKEEPDILCIQEFYYSGRKNYFKTLDTLVQLLKGKNYHVEYPQKGVQKQYFGIITFSKYPILHKGSIAFEENSYNTIIYSDLLIGRDTVRVYNAHLSSIRFENVDYQFLDEMADAETEHQIQGGKKILRRLKHAFVKRAKQADILAAHIKDCPYPVIVCGDFNDSPTSYAYRTISNRLKDAFEKSGTGFGITYNGKFPAFRIDYILHSDEMKAYNFETLPDDLSDHFPVTCKLVLDKD